MKKHLIYASVIGFSGMILLILGAVFLSRLVNQVPIDKLISGMPFLILALSFVAALISRWLTIRLSGGLELQAIKTQVAQAVRLATLLVNLPIFLLTGYITYLVFLSPRGAALEYTSLFWFMSLGLSLIILLFIFILGFMARLFVRQQPGINP